MYHVGKSDNERYDRPSLAPDEAAVNRAFENIVRFDFCKVAIQQFGKQSNMSA